MFLSDEVVFLSKTEVFVNTLKAEFLKNLKTRFYLATNKTHKKPALNTNQRQIRYIGREDRLSIGETAL